MLLLLSVCLFNGCSTDAGKAEQLSGTWYTVLETPREQTIALLKNADLFPEEIALAEDIPLTYMQVLEFTADKSYRFYIAADDTLAYVHSYFEAVFDALYEGRETLNNCYGQDFGPMTQEEFQQFYARLYVVNDFDALISQLVTCAYDPAKLDMPWECGTFTIKAGKLLCTVNGETQPESLGYLLHGDQLTLYYGNATEIYTRIK